MFLSTQTYIILETTHNKKTAEKTKTTINTLLKDGVSQCFRGKSLASQTSLNVLQGPFMEILIS